jgi:hypothetical protein
MMPKKAQKVDVKVERRRSNQSLELRTQKQKIKNQRDEIAKLKRALKDAISSAGAQLIERAK